MLDPNAKLFTFQTFTDRERKPHPDPFAKVFNLSRFTRDLFHLYEKGAGVWVTVNDTEGNGRKANAITRVRAVWQEDDDRYEGFFPLEPSLVVETSPGHFHRYWLIEDDWPADECGRKDFAGVMARMVASYGSDKGAKDISRVLRVPGFQHRKKPAEPHIVRIVGGDGRRYTRPEILAAFPPVEKTSTACGNGRANGSDRESHADLVRQVLTGENYHSALTSLAWRHVGTDMPAGQVVEHLRGLMLSIPEERQDERWQARLAEIPRIVSSAQEKRGKSNDAEPSEARDIKAWPIMESKAAHGIVGRIAQLATEKSEADPVAIIATTLAYAGAEFGRAQFIRIGDTIHHSRHFEAIVGKSSRGRKGTSYDPVERFFKRAEETRTAKSSLPFPSGSRLQVSPGPLSSGEGLVYAIRDGSDPGDHCADPGVVDKRLLVVEEELGAALRAFQRSGNNLSMILRRGFDGKTIAPMTKNNRVVATNPHISIVAHITRPELNSLLTGTEVWNGFANRFQWLMARRTKEVPFPEPMPADEVEKIAQELAHVIELAHKNSGRELVLSNSAQDHWANVYPELTTDHPGILGAVTSRQEAHARRLALTYAQLDGANRIESEHLEAALAFCRYAFDSAVYLFGETELDPVAQKILEALATAKEKGLNGLTQTQVSDLFSRNMKADDLAAVLEDLQDRGRITLTKVKTGERGRSPSIWSINERN